MPTLAFEDVITVPSSRTTTHDGYVTAPATLARAGVQSYRFAELGMRDGKHKPEDMVGTLILRDANAIAKINAGRSQLSNGYRGEIIPRRGVHEGQTYEFEQTNLVGNHVAIVDKARCGTSCRIMDSPGCSCGGHAGHCNCQEHDPRQQAMERQSHSWKLSWGESTPPDDHHPEPEDIDPREAYKQRQQNAWQHW
jgi:hypothetical protein